MDLSSVIQIPSRLFLRTLLILPGNRNHDGRNIWSDSTYLLCGFGTGSNWTHSSLPIGGLGTSGHGCYQGCYHGQHSFQFKTFSHCRSTICRPATNKVKLLSTFVGIRHSPFYQQKHNDPNGNKKLQQQYLTRYQMKSWLLLLLLLLLLAKLGSISIPVTRRNLCWLVQYYIMSR